MPASITDIRRNIYCSRISVLVKPAAFITAIPYLSFAISSLTKSRVINAVMSTAAAAAASAAQFTDRSVCPYVCDTYSRIS